MGYDENRFNAAFDWEIFMLRYLTTSAILLSCLFSVHGFAETPMVSAVPASWLPDSTVVYAQSADAKTYAELPVVKQVIGSAVFQEVWRSPEVMKLRGGITLAELALGERLPQVIHKLSAHGIVVAIDAKSKGVVLMAHAQDATTSASLCKKLFDIANNDAKSKGNPGRAKSAVYRGMEGYQIDDAIIVTIDDWLCVSNKGELIKKIIDNKIDGAKATLWDSVAFQSAANRRTVNEHLTLLAWTYFDVEQLRKAGVARDLFKRPKENFAAELLIGGLLASVREATTASSTLVVDDGLLKWNLRAEPARLAQMPEYEFFFGPMNSGFSPPPISLPGRLLSLSAYRDVAQLWQGAGDLFGARTNDQLAQAETTLTTLFSGRDFGQDILGAIEPGLQLVVVEQDFTTAEFKPKIQLPAFALITKLRNPAVMQGQLKRIFSSLIGFLNITGAQNQQPQLDLESVKEGGDLYVMATYSPDVDRPRNWTVPLQFNFSPTLAMSGDYAILASTSKIARTIMDRIKDVSLAGSIMDKNCNTKLSISGGLVANALAANRSQLVSQNMLEKGHSREEAENEIGLLLKLIGLVQSLDIDFRIDNQIEAELEFILKPTP